MKKSIGFRVWFYFRQGWTIYFAFGFSAINTMVTTYYLAIKDIGFLKYIFPSFLSYVIVLTAIGVPVLVIAGYLHYKKSHAFKAEADINIEANPHLRRILTNTEMIYPMYLKLSKMMIKLSRNEKLTEDEVEEMKKLHEQLESNMKNRTIKEENI